MHTLGEGIYKVWLEKKKIDSDLVYLLGGGEKSHIGGVVICEPGSPIKVISLGEHFDYIVLKPIAEAACKKYKTTVVVIGGVHIDNASKEQIEKLIENCGSLVACI